MLQDRETKNIFIEDLRDYLKSKRQNELLVKLDFIQNYTIESEDIIEELMTLTKAEAVSDFESKRKKYY